MLPNTPFNAVFGQKITSLLTAAQGAQIYYTHHRLSFFRVEPDIGKIDDSAAARVAGVKFIPIRLICRKKIVRRFTAEKNDRTFGFEFETVLQQTRFFV